MPKLARTATLAALYPLRYYAFITAPRGWSVFDATGVALPTSGRLLTPGTTQSPNR